MNALFGGPYSTHAKRVAIWNRAAPDPGLRQGDLAPRRPGPDHPLVRL